MTKLTVPIRKPSSRER